MSTETPRPTAMSREELEDEVDELRERVERLEELAVAQTAPEAPDGAEQITINDTPVGVYARKHQTRVDEIAEYLFGGAISDVVSNDFDQIGGYEIEQFVAERGRLQSELGQLDESIEHEQVMRSQEDTKLKSRINAVADAADVEVTDADVMGDDKIKRAIVEGPDAVESNPKATANRAAVLLDKLSTWGTVTTDGHYGARVTITSPQARDHLNDCDVLPEDTNLKSRQIGLVFDKIVNEWAAGSPRDASVKSDGRTKVLQIQLEGVDD